MHQETWSFEIYVEVVFLFKKKWSYNGIHNHSNFIQVPLWVICVRKSIQFCRFVKYPFFLPISHHPGVDRIFNSALLNRSSLIRWNWNKPLIPDIQCRPPWSRSRATIFAPSELLYLVGLSGWNSPLKQDPTITTLMIWNMLGQVLGIPT